jgi:DNA topoisomerase-3
LPVEHFLSAPSLITAISSHSTSLEAMARGADTSIKGRVWNDGKVEAHHAIIPTAKKMDFTRLSKQERELYELIARQYLCQFYPKWEYSDTRVEITIEGGLFVAGSRITKSLGWKVLFDASILMSIDEAENGENKEHCVGRLPDLKRGDLLLCVKGELLEKQTQPPKYFTDASLLAAMTGIARYVNDPHIRKILKETDGLGTEATRAGILDLLFKREYLLRQGKRIYASQAARVLVESLPLSATTPDMTAQWESALESVSLRKSSYASFMEPLINTLNELIQQSHCVLPMALNGLAIKAKSSKGGSSKKHYRKKAKIV